MGIGLINADLDVPIPGEPLVAGILGVVRQVALSELCGAGIRMPPALSG
ncbi:MAG: hypothetical protein VYB05_01580 [Pseudomonadota bacterium]|nr:hypothetical protein [Pseudomonadota bacterium]